MDDRTEADFRPVVLCPLQFEARELRRHGLEGRVRLVCCGPGREGIVGWTERGGADERHVILAGLAGSLRESASPGDAFIITTVIAASARSGSAGQSKRQTALAILDRMDPAARPRRASVATSDHILLTPDEKRAWSDRTGAELVDLESDVFAQAAELFGWRWYIVRGVSDAHDVALPPGIEKWVDRRGRSRIPRILVDVMRRPWSIMTLLRLRRDSRRAMSGVALAITRLLDAEAHGAQQSSHESPRSDSARGAAKSQPSAETSSLHGPVAGARQRFPVLVFGGTFDPPHRGHVEIPFQVAEQLGCGRLIFVPTSSNPLKGEEPTLPTHRLAMLRLAIGNRPGAEIDSGELFQQGPSYTVDTIERLRRDLGAEKPEDLRLLIGSDAAASFHRWKDWRRILEYARPAVVLRDGITREAFLASMREAIGDDAAGWEPWIVDAPRVDISATELRRHLQAGEPIDPGRLDPAVLAYARAHRLYEAPRPPRQGERASQSSGPAADAALD